MDILIGIGSALWLGILTSISPCSLASNIAAITFLSKRIVHPKAVFWSGVAYTAGRMLSYALLGFIIISSFLSVPALANLLQKYMNKAFGPLLVVVGLALLDVIKLNIPSFAISKKHQNAFAGSGTLGVFALGLIFALVFCPISAALFFGSLIPLALSHKLGVGLPLVYGVGTGLPALVFTLFIALGVTSLSRWLNRLTRAERFMRRITGAVFILVGFYYIAAYIVKIL